jgi:hypothetical protein
MASYLKSTSAVSARNHKRKHRLVRNEGLVKELSLGPINVYNPREEGRLGKGFEILRSRVSNEKQERYNTSRVCQDPPRDSTDTPVKENTVRYAHI